MNKLYAALAAAAIAAPTAVVLASPAAADQEVYYKNCDAVRAAGKAPLYRGEPGYRPPLDRDNDGIACEVRGSSGRSEGSGDSNDDSKDDKDSNSSNDRSYDQVGEDDVPTGGVSTGGWPT